MCADFKLDLINEEPWQFKTQWSGCENVLFIPDTLVVSALDSTSIVVAVDQAQPAADDPASGARKPTGVGHSIVAGPLGEVLLELGPGPELALIDLDLDSVAQARKALPVLGNSRFSSSLDR